jgi:hypothetical protein
MLRNGSSERLTRTVRGEQPAEVETIIASSCGIKDDGRPDLDYVGNARRTACRLALGASVDRKYRHLPSRAHSLFHVLGASIRHVDLGRALERRPYRTASSKIVKFWL